MNISFFSLAIQTDDQKTHSLLQHCC